MKMNKSIKSITLNDALYVSDLRTNLLSVSRMTDKGLKMTFEKDCASVIGDDGTVKLISERFGGLCFVHECG